MSQNIAENVTAGVSCVRSDIKALLLCLSSILNATGVPAAIKVRFEGPISAFGDFYLEQIADLARLKGVEFSIHVAQSKGVRAARDWHIANCDTQFLWMLDDDVVYAYDCLAQLLNGQVFLCDNNVAYLCGTKADVNNRRGYKDFSIEEHPASDVKDNGSYNWLYDKDACAGKYAEIWTADTGNLLIDIQRIRSARICFQLFPDSTNCGGEDTLFALECRKAGYRAFMVPSAQSFHLEKPVVNFNEFSARAEMILRVAALRSYDAKDMQKVRESFFPWEFRK